MPRSNPSNAESTRDVAARLYIVESNALQHAATLAKDPSLAVRREVALALRDVPLAQCQDITLDLAKGYDQKDRWYLEALGTACTNKESKVYPLLLKELGNPDSTQWSERFAEIAWRLHPPSTFIAFRNRAMDARLSLADRKAALTALGFIATKGAAMAMVYLAEKGGDDIRPLAKWWLYNRGSHVWSEFSDQMKGLNEKPNQLKPDQDYKAPIDGPEITKLDLKEILSLQGDAVRGKAHVARCYMCHQIDGQGVDFGPVLEGWGKGNSREVIATALIEPGKDIAHGFEAAEITTKDGHTIQGFVLFAGGSYIIKVFGGGEVSIPRKLITDTKPMERSLMMSAGQLGMQAQEVADIVAYLKEGAPVADTASPSAPEAKAKAMPAPAATAPKPTVFKKAKPRNNDPLLDPFANPVDNPALPRVLIVGDSISIGYTTGVRKLLDGKANVHRVEGNCRWSAYGVNHIDEWLGESQWDVIHFNFGLWDWYGWAQDTKATPKSYAQSLDQIVTRLKQTNAKLIFAVTTPPCVGPEKKVKITITEDRAREFNDAAIAVMEKHGVQINDLYSLIGDQRSDYRNAENDVHYNNEGKELLAARVSEVIEKALPSKKSSGKTADIWRHEVSKDRKRFLFIAGDTKHRHGVHEYRAGSMLLANALNESGLAVEARVHWYGWPEDESIFDGVDTCIIYAGGGGELGEKYAVLDRKVEAGMGIMFMHYTGFTLPKNSSVPREFSNARS